GPPADPSVQSAERPQSPVRRRIRGLAGSEIPPSHRGRLMNRRARGSDDPRPLLALLACVAGYSFLRLAHHLDPGRLSKIEPRGSTIAIAAGVTLIASALAR